MTNLSFSTFLTEDCDYFTSFDDIEHCAVYNPVDDKDFLIIGHIIYHQLIFMDFLFSTLMAETRDRFLKNVLSLYFGSC